jgi:RND family efflux transporter MFP subunit
MKSAKNYLDAAKNSGSQTDIDAAVGQAITSLDNVYNDLKVIRDQCDQGIYYTTVSPAEKASLDGQKTYINSSATAVATLQQNISSYKIALQSAKDTLAVATADPRSEDIEIYKSQIDQAQANVNLYQSQMSSNSITSPMDGRITAVNAKRGEVVSYSVPIIQMLSSEPFQVKVNIYEQDIVNVDPGDAVKIDLVAFEGQTFEGKVLSVDPAEKIVDNVVYYETTIEFPSQPAGIRSGMTADITVEAAKKENVLRIPKNIIEEVDGKKMVEVVVGKKIEKREIETGFEGNDYYEVISGLSEGDQVVVSAP